MNSRCLLSKERTPQMIGFALTNMELETEIKAKMLNKLLSYGIKDLKNKKPNIQIIIVI